ncbi:MAG: hypothetical protein MI861_17325, partial [Pirellulales bacterium]|nr:hypothetical protein [Pirellulales bacterium]
MAVPAAEAAAPLSFMSKASSPSDVPTSMPAVVMPKQGKVVPRDWVASAVVAPVRAALRVSAAPMPLAEAAATEVNR